VSPFPREALEAIGQDIWTVERVRFHLGLDDDWHNGVAAGTFLRLRLRETRQTPSLSVSESWPHRWITGQTIEQRETLASRAIARTDGLWHWLEQLEQEPQFDGADWRNALQLLCEGREEVEGVRILLDWARHESALGSMLSAFDRAADLFVRSIPVALTMRSSELLRRAAIVSPTAWWTQFAT
jgi:hypothetical protein